MYESSKKLSGVHNSVSTVTPYHWHLMLRMVDDSVVMGDSGDNRVVFDGEVVGLLMWQVFQPIKSITLPMGISNCCIDYLDRPIDT